MNFKRYIKLTGIFTLIFSIIAGVILAGFYFGFKLRPGGNSVLDGIAKVMGITGGKVNVLVVGSADNDGPPDTIFFVSYDPSTQKVNLISIPRDTRVPDSADKKINSAIEEKGKIKATEKDVENILGLHIDYYVLVHLKAFKTAVDEIGGIPIDVPIDMHYHDPYQNLYIDLNKGYQVLDGNKAVGFVRFRHGYSDQDLGRIKAQQAFISAFKEQLFKPENIIKIPSIINTVMSNVETDMPLSKILSYVNDAAKINSGDIVMKTLPGTPKYIDGLSYYIYDKEKTKQMVDSMFENQGNVKASADNQINVEKNKNIKVEVYNGTDVLGLATKVANQLKAKGFKITRIANYDNTDEQTTKIYIRKENIDGNAVKSVMNTGKIQPEYNDSDVDVTVILGQDASN